MALLNIARMGHPILRRPARAIDDPTAPEIRKLAVDMVETMIAAPGVGLAGPQVFEGVRIIAFQIPAERAEDGQEIGATVLINPELVPLGERIVQDWEGCLSMPGLRGMVPRQMRLGWRGLALDGRLVEGEAEGLFARILQHEVDHLDGLLYVDRMPDLTMFSYEEEVRHFDQAG